MGDARGLAVLDAPSTVTPDRAALALRQTLVAYARHGSGGAQALREAGCLLLAHGDAARVVLWMRGWGDRGQAVDAARYREFVAGYVRAPYTQDVQYDLSTDHTIGFKGARIEVLEATNTMLRYRVIQSFPVEPGLVPPSQPAPEP